MHMQDLIGGIEAILFASANPMTESDLRKVVNRWVISLPPETDEEAESAVSPLQLEAPEMLAEQGVDAAGEQNDVAAAADTQIRTDDHGMVQASDDSDDVTPEPEPQADGNLEEPVAIPDEELEAAGSDAAPDAQADNDDDDDNDNEEGETQTPAEKDVKSGRLTLDTPLPKVAAASGRDVTTIEAETDDAPFTASDDAEIATKPDVASDAFDDAAQGDTLAAASDAEQDVQDDGAAAAEPLAASSPALTRFDWRKNFKAAVAAVKMRWQDPPEYCGFTLVEVADALTFRSNPRFAPVLLAMRDEKPPKLSRAAMETLAIIAYRQPVTKPESDHIRGVDCGGTIKMLLDRNLIRIVGKKEEPGRPLLYGTGPEFLSFFNLASVHHLPSLRAFDELNDDSEDALRELDALPSLQELSAQAKQFRLDDEPAMGSLDAAVDALRRTESTSRDALAAQGITLAGDEDDKAPAAPAPTQH